MLKRSRRITLVLIGISGLAGCGDGEDTQRQVYRTREDCLADWSNKPENCNRATEGAHASSGYWYGPLIGAGLGYALGRSTAPGSSVTQPGAPASRAIGTTLARSGGSVSRGGFGSTGMSSSG